jgi:hypothetical protein
MNGLDGRKEIPILGFLAEVVVQLALSDVEVRAVRA